MNHFLQVTWKDLDARFMVYSGQCQDREISEHGFKSMRLYTLPRGKIREDKDTGLGRGMQWVPLDI